MRTTLFILFVTVLVGQLAASQGIAGQRTVEITPAQLEDGRPLPLWIDSLKRRMPEEEWRTYGEIRKPLNEEERAWLALIESVSDDWLASVPEIDAGFPKVRPPETIRILAGNQGGNDGFTHLLDIICTDLSDLIRNYGSADKPENRNRMIRILSHEYTHLLTKAWLADHPWLDDTPFRSVLWELYYEGLGNMQSLILSEKWITADYQLTERARKTIRELEPVMLKRLSELAKNPGPEEETALRRNLSAGPFTKKWGALPIALWLAVETRFEPTEIAEWVERGPAGILEIATKYSAANNHPTFNYLLDQAKRQSVISD